VSATSDRWNPILLKEVRQALRGKMFAFLFPATVLVGVGLAIAVLIDSYPRSNMGPQVFLPVILVLGIAALGLVPFSSFQSMGAEWDEGTHDLLVLSHLSPTRIVLGKLLTASVESGLYFAAFLPILLFTFLLNGVALQDVLFLVGMLYCASLSMSAIAMSLAGLTRVRFLRVVLLAVLAGIGFLALLGGYELAEQFVLRGRGLGSSFSADAVLAVTTLVFGPGILAFAFAATRIAHPEDDRSGPVRIACTAVLVMTLAGLSWGVLRSGSGMPTYIVAVVVGVLASIFAVFFVTEPERLPRRCAHRIPTNAIRALLLTPFLPGGGRGVIWWFLQLVIVAIWASALESVYPMTISFRDPWSPETFGRWCAFMAYFVVYLAGFSLALAPLCKRSYGPLAARIILPSVAVLSMVLPMFLGFLFDEPRWQHGHHPLSPFDIIDGGGRSGVRIMALLVAFLVLLANAPRLARSVQEVLAASRARRAVLTRIGIEAPRAV